jgi:hypothetical protein
VTNQLILSRLVRSFERLFDHDGELFERGQGGVHEQTLTFRLGIYLQGEFPTLHVDCEYNRRGNELKKRRRGGQLIKPDVVVHKRGVPNTNLLIIEAKKSSQWNANFRELSDKICDLTNQAGQYRYKIGLCWNVAESRTRADHRAYWFSNGEFVLDTPLHRFQSAVLAKFQELGYDG